MCGSIADANMTSCCSAISAILRRGRRTTKATVAHACMQWIGIDMICHADRAPCTPYTPFTHVSKSCKQVRLVTSPGFAQVNLHVERRSRHGTLNCQAKRASTDTQPTTRSSAQKNRNKMSRPERLAKNPDRSCKGRRKPRARNHHGATQSQV